MERYAGVIVDISTDKLDRPFCYRIPDAIKEIKVGSAVVFPFGKSNSLRKGYVISISDKPDFDSSKIKELYKVDDKKTDINSQMIALAWWMKQRFGCTMNQAMKTVMPVKAKVIQKQKLFISLLLDDDTAEKEAELAEKRNATAQAQLLRSLCGCTELEQSYITQQLKIPLQTVKALEKKGFIKLYENENSNKRYTKEIIKPVLNSQQQKAFYDIYSDYRSENKHTWLLQGITGSGKTEVYLELIEKVLEEKRQVIVLIPEISLTPQTVMRFYRRFGDRIAMVHSKLAAGEKYRQFCRAMNGEIDIMIGPRSALFTPFNNLGMIIIDEEHEDSYISENSPKYNAKEVAIARCRMSSGVVILGSATPSLETRYLADAGVYKKALLTVRGHSGATLPDVYVADLRTEMKAGNRTILSRILKEKINERLDKKEQIMLFLNRRGYSNCISCRSCGNAVMCPNCDISLTLHKDNTLKCHYCGHTIPVMKLCPSCQSPFLAGLGIGTERAVELVAKEFPEARILRMDMDSTSKAGSHEKILEAFAKHEADILLGTQMIVKGHDFGNVTLVGILVADKSLYAGTYKAAEKTFQLLTQAAGRAGRGNTKGEVVIQTYRPEHFAIECASRQDYENFYSREIGYRKLLDYPPVSRMLSVLVTSPIEADADTAAKILVDKTISKGFTKINGPTADSIGRINNLYRKIFFVRSKKIDELILLQEELSHNDDFSFLNNIVVECNLT